MKILGIFLLALLTIFAVACFLDDDPTKPDPLPVKDNFYDAELVADGVLGWETMVEYPGMYVGYYGDYVVGTQDHYVRWASEYDITERVDGQDKPVIVQTRFTVRDATQKPIFVFWIDKDKTTREGSTWTGKGWKKQGGRYFVQLDCR